MIAVAIPAMAKSLGETPLRLSLVITAYLLSLAVFIPVSGWIADRFGARRVFCAAVLIFAGGSALCGMADSLPMLIAMRVVQGFGGAMMTPVGRLVLLRSFPRAALVSAMNWMTIPSMIGPMVGPVIGGVLTDYASWRWIFFLNIPIGVLGGALALWFFKDFRAPAPARFDLVGFAIIGVALFLLELALENVGHPVLPPALGIAFFPIAAVMLLAYWHHARHSPAPVLDLNLLQIKTFNIGTVVGGLCRIGLDATPFLLPLLFQIGFGRSATEAGLLTFSSMFGAMSVRTLVASAVAADRVPPRPGRRRRAVGRGDGLLRAAGRREPGLGHRAGGFRLGLRAQHPVSRAEHDQLCRRAVGDAEPRHGVRRRRAAIGARVRGRDRGGAARHRGRRRTGRDRPFPHRLRADRAVAAALGARLHAAVAERRRRGQRLPGFGKSGRG